MNIYRGMLVTTVLIAGMMKCNVNRTSSKSESKQSLLSQKKRSRHTTLKNDCIAVWIFTSFSLYHFLFQKGNQTHIPTKLVMMMVVTVVVKVKWLLS